MSDPKKLFSALFEPKRIALIGASADEKKTTSRPQRFLRKHGFSGEILPVNPSRTEILGDKAYKDLEAIPGEIDHAYILLNGKDAVAALAACGRRGVKVASILAGGFADAGAAGASLQDDLARIVGETGVRPVGPNASARSVPSRRWRSPPTQPLPSTNCEKEAGRWSARAAVSSGRCCRGRMRAASAFRA
jgi:predicted CoA-binding protein